MSRLQHPIVTALAAFFLIAGCGNASTGGAGASGGGNHCGDLSCPAGCSMAPSCNACVPVTPGAGLGNACRSDTDCCTGNCVRGICTQLATVATTTGTASGSTSGASSSSGGDGGCNPPTPEGNTCTVDTDCANPDYYCSGRTTKRCRAKCTFYACECYGGFVCDMTSGKCFNPDAGVSTTSSTSGTTSTTGRTTTATTSGTTGTRTSTTSGTTGTQTSSGTTGHTTSITTTSTTTSSSTTSGTSGGTILVGDTCAICTYDSDCAAPDWCITDPTDGNGYCAPDCTTGTCATSYTCGPQTDNDPFNGQTEQVCYPSSGTCTGGASSTSSSTSGSASGGSNIGATCTLATDCTSGYCLQSSGLCTCNCGGGIYPCVTNADCCTAPGQGNSCAASSLSTGCVNGVCF